MWVSHKPKCPSPELFLVELNPTMTDNPYNPDRSFRNNCDIHFIQENFRFRETPPTRIAPWKCISFMFLVTVFFLVNLKIRIHGAKVKYHKNYVDSLLHGYSEFDRRNCPELKFLDKTKSIYWVFKTLSHDFHRVPEHIVRNKLTRELAKEGSGKDSKIKEYDPRVIPSRKVKKLDAEDQVKDYILPALIIVLLLALTGKTVWDVTGNMNVAKKKPSLSSVSRRPSLRQNLYRKMSDTNISGVRRASYHRQSSQPDIKRKLSLVKEALLVPGDLTRQYSAPASYMSPPDSIRRSHAIDYSSEDDPMSPETKRRVRMIRRY